MEGKSIINEYKGVLVRGERDGVNDVMVESLPKEGGLIPTKWQRI